MKNLYVYAVNPFSDLGYDFIFTYYTTISSPTKLQRRALVLEKCLNVSSKCRYVVRLSKIGENHSVAKQFEFPF